ncbi:hypothetical protein F5B20DRAFT_531380 [Whalleya microplaca]|nr:hypothetical protein F5B20DRAFT_531380 [Whalleya microplaca]
MSEKSDHDDSDHDGSIGLEQDGLDEYDSDESGSENGNDLLDMEAVESDGWEDDDDDNDDDVNNDGMTAYSVSGRPISKTRESYYFPQFCKLPIELRRRIWEFFDPDLRSKARVFEFNILQKEPLVLVEGATLEQQTAPARAMLATYYESRELALKYYPDTLDTILPGSGRTLRFNAEQDVICISGRCIHYDAFESLIDMIGNTRYLALDISEATYVDTLRQVTMNRPELLENLKGIYYCYDTADMVRWRRQKWWRDCLGGHNFYTQAEEEQPGVGEDVEFMYCWPLHPTEYSPLGQPGNYLPGIGMSPMLRFSFEDGLNEYHEGRALMLSSDVDSSSDSESSESDTEEDEYESEGIDDATIGSSDGSEAESDVLDNADVDTLRESLSPDHLGVGWEGEIAVGQFSSPEPESPDGNGINVDRSASDEEEPVRVASRRKRRVVSSDDEQDPEDEPKEDVEQQSRPIKRSRVVLSDSEDEAEEEVKTQSRSAKRSRVVLSDSEDEDDDEDAKQSQKSEDESEEDEIAQEVSEDEEPARTTKPMSLLQKLRQLPQKKRASYESDDASGESHGGDFDGSSDIKFQDDDGDGEGFLDGAEDEDGQTGYMLEGANEDEFADEAENW